LSGKIAAPSPRGTAWAFSNVSAEAKSLFRLVLRKVETVESMRELIRVTPQELHVLQAFMVKFPELSRQVECAIAFRQNVLKEFELLVSQRNARSSSSHLSLDESGKAQDFRGLPGRMNSLPRRY
jgi:hypothetical protein